MLIEKVGKDGKNGPFLVEIDNALGTIKEVRRVNGKNGFVGADGDREIDGSGIDYDRTAKNSFSIVSEEGGHLFHYDWDSNRAAPKIDLTCAR